MAGITELLRAEEDGTLSFGNYELASKTKLSDFEFKGDVYKVKTFKDITRLEKNDSLVYESVPGTVVKNFKMTEDGAEFVIDSFDDTQITMELEEGTDYEIFTNGGLAGEWKTNLGGKLVYAFVHKRDEDVKIEIKKK